MSEPAIATRRATALAVGALSASSFYVIATIYEQIVAGPTDPFLIVRDVHFGYYHRAVLAAWLGGVAALVAWRSLDAPERVARVERWVTTLTLPLVVLLGIAATVFP